MLERRAAKEDLPYPVYVRRLLGLSNGKSPTVAERVVEEDRPKVEPPVEEPEAPSVDPGRLEQKIKEVMANRDCSRKTAIPIAERILSR